VRVRATGLTMMAFLVGLVLWTSARASRLWARFFGRLSSVWASATRCSRKKISILLQGHYDWRKSLKLQKKRGMSRTFRKFEEFFFQKWLQPACEQFIWLMNIKA
jgi:hypothetical protein